MSKFFRKFSDFMSNVAVYAFIVAFTLGGIGCAILSVKWVLELLGVI